MSSDLIEILTLVSCQTGIISYLIFVKHTIVQHLRFISHQFMILRISQPCIVCFISSRKILILEVKLTDVHQESTELHQVAFVLFRIFLFLVILVAFFVCVQTSIQVFSKLCRIQRLVSSRFVQFICKKPLVQISLNIPSQSHVFGFSAVQSFGQQRLGFLYLIVVNQSLSFFHQSVLRESTG